MAWSPDCRTLASCFVCLLAFGSTAATYDVQTGAQLPAMFGVEYAKRVTALAWRSDSQACLLHVLHEAQCKLVWWNPGTSTSHTCSFLQPGSHYRVAFSPDGTLFACVVPAYDSEKAGRALRLFVGSSLSLNMHVTHAEPDRLYDTGCVMIEPPALWRHYVNAPFLIQCFLERRKASAQDIFMSTLPMHIKLLVHKL